MSGPRAEGQTFQSCPAQTGELRSLCYPDGAHRCGLERGYHRDHRCTCGQMWTEALWLDESKYQVGT